MAFSQVDKAIGTDRGQDRDEDVDVASPRPVPKRQPSAPPAYADVHPVRVAPRVSPSRSQSRDEDEPGWAVPLPVLLGGGGGLATILGLSACLSFFGGSSTSEETEVASNTPEAAASGNLNASADSDKANSPLAAYADDLNPPKEPSAGRRKPPVVVVHPQPASESAELAAPVLGAQPAYASNIPPAAPNIPPATVPIQPATSVANSGQGMNSADPGDSIGESDIARNARAGLAGGSHQAGGKGRPLSTAEVVEESEPSVALVKGRGSSHTGFLVAPGLLATNSHVIDDEFVADLEVRFVSADDRHKAPLKAELLYEDASRDLAFLAVKTDLKPLRVAKSYSFKKGEDITVIGSPGMGDGQVLENAISRGVDEHQDSNRQA